VFIVAIKTPLAGPPQETHALHETRAVFVDSSGRRTRIARRLGLGLGLALTVCLAALGVSLVADADVPLTPWTNGGAAKRTPGLELERKVRQRAERLNPAPSTRPRTSVTPAPSPAVRTSQPAQPAQPAPTAPAATGSPAAPGNGKAVGKTAAPGRERNPRQTAP
jgi:hypothetical protein